MLTTRWPHTRRLHLCTATHRTPDVTRSHFSLKSYSASNIGKLTSAKNRAFSVYEHGHILVTSSERRRVRRLAPSHARAVGKCNGGRIRKVRPQSSNSFSFSRFPQWQPLPVDTRTPLLLIPPLSFDQF